VDSLNPHLSIDRLVYMYVVDVVRYLVNSCRDVVNLSTVTGRTCLHIAALTDDLALLHCLLDDLNADCNLTLRFKVHRRRH